MRRRAAVTLVVAAAAVVVAGAGWPAVSSPPTIYGYPYAAHCPDDGLAEVVDRWGMYACNCTSYVAWALVANGQRIDWFIPGAMDAWNWPHVARLRGLRVDVTPAVGAVAVWPHVDPPLGHVAYVTGLRSRRLIDVAEYNFPLLGFDTFSFDTRDLVSTRGAVFIHVPKRSSAVS
jgi:surface antigen